MFSFNAVLRSQLNVGHGEDRIMCDCTHYNPSIAYLSPLERTGAPEY